MSCRATSWISTTPLVLSVIPGCTPACSSQSSWQRVLAYLMLQQYGGWLISFITSSDRPCCTQALHRPPMWHKFPSQRHHLSFASKMLWERRTLTWNMPLKNMELSESREQCARSLSSPTLSITSDSDLLYRRTQACVKNLCDSSSRGVSRLPGLVSCKLVRCVGE